MSNLYFLCLLAALWAGVQGARPFWEFPLLSANPIDPTMYEVDIGRKDKPVVFQYRIVPRREASRYPPWVKDEVVDAIVQQGATCSDFLQNRIVRFRDINGQEMVFPLEPVPLEQIWPLDGTKIKTDNPGIQRNRVSSCCDAQACRDRCLLFPNGENWILEINALRWGVDQVDEVYRVEGEAYTFETVETKKDPGVWPVMRIACRYCPLTSCVTNCSNGEYATGFADLSVSRFPCVFVFIGGKPDPRSRQTGIQVNRVECKPCAPGTWNTCKEKANCRWFIPQGLDNTLGEDIHVFPGGPGQASFFYLESSSRRARDARLFRVQCRPATPARR
jgi:hypothetical protein